MAARYGAKLNHKAIHELLTSDPAFDADLVMANKVCDAANKWADGIARSGAHPHDNGPHFWVVSQPSRNRARYVVAPCSGFGFWLTRTRPLDFMSCLQAGR